ncbi:hypothetical protein JPSP39_17220 [Staphylococcus pseudintermedius]
MKRLVVSALFSMIFYLSGVSHFKKEAMFLKIVPLIYHLSELLLNIQEY